MDPSIAPVARRDCSCNRASAVDSGRQRRNILGVRLLAVCLVAVPAAASATIYKWTDDDGRVVYANHAPEAGTKNVHVMKIDDTPTPPSAAAQRALEERIARLEQQVQARPPAPAAPPAPYPYASAVPPTPMPDYYGAAPYGYGYPAVGYGFPYAVRVIRPVPRFAPRPFVSFHHAGIRRR
jgi:uncharacterized protein DUF4124